MHRRPKVAIVATGDELVPPGTEPGPGQIVYSNVFALAALARREGAEVIDLGILPDRLEETIAGVRRAREAGADVLLTAGGASVGDYDLVQPALAAEGLALSFWKVAVRPGKPLLLGRLGAMRVLGLPGNPVSAYVCAVLFLVPLIRRLSGRRDVAPRARAGRARPRPAGQRRARRLHARDARAARRRHAGRDAVSACRTVLMLVPLAAADCLVVRAPHAPAAAAGSPCVFVKLDD